ncbi:MAG: hypothetical protein COZ68_02080 [Deltaproteobacteria bacterium CG_4_8_14_3_um_filter_43_13]|nr:MAG: hypothetical protein COS67_05885 [Deltaproteobacteria bacterium CG06_land_8_20_14_3_00_44_19]PIX26153.1 MAG: hypothetical protein COZ68_02080 [Deltaproteobacteria bacterium CG_4_8_14_3_um_filter_43_13]
MRIIEYRLSAERICLGERVKGGVYKPSTNIIGYTRLKGAIYDALGISAHAVGVIDSIDNISYITMGPKCRNTEVVRLPIKIMYLEGVKGYAYILDEDNLYGDLPEEMSLHIGGLRMKGFGQCILNNKQQSQLSIEDVQEGILSTRIPKEVAGVFNINVLKEKLGYLFLRDNEETGRYVLAYFEGSKVKAPRFLLEGGTHMADYKGLEEIVRQAESDNDLRSYLKEGSVLSSGVINDIGTLMEEGGKGLVVLQLKELSSKNERNAPAVHKLYEYVEKVDGLNIPRCVKGFFLKKLKSIATIQIKNERGE